MASIPFTLIISSIYFTSKFLGMKPAPIPYIKWGLGLPPDKTGDSNGSTAIVWIFGFCDFKYLLQPVIVPPVPAPVTKISIFPSVYSHISGPVVSKWAFILSGFVNY